MSYCTLNTALYQLVKIIEARQDENIFFQKSSEITLIFLITKPQ